MDHCIDVKRFLLFLFLSYFYIVNVFYIFFNVFIVNKR